MRTSREREKVGAKESGKGDIMDLLYGESERERCVYDKERETVIRQTVTDRQRDRLTSDMDIEI